LAVSVKIATDVESPRLHYVCDVIFKELLGITYEITPDSPHITYGTSESGLKIVPHGLLTESDIRQDILREITFERWDETKCFFKTSQSDIPFDMFSASFFLLSRYEEYVVEDRDAHNRFSAESSILLKNNVLQEPLINIWALKLKSQLQKRYPELKFTPRQFQFKSTIDIDQTWKFKHKGIGRSSLAAMRDLLKGNSENFVDRIKVALRLKPDPFYNFDWQNELHNRHDVDVNYFWLLGDYSTYDKNIPYTNAAQKELILSVLKRENSQVGIHPSYASNDDENKVVAEIKRLKSIIGDFKTSRQHFLKLILPKTYQHLLNQGIHEDHTMGYSTHHGFRAGIAAPFPFYDLTENKVTSLQLIPFCVMDITSPHYYGETPDQAIATLKTQMDKVAEMGGLFVSLWHNESLSETERWKGWRIVYEEMIKYGYYLTTL
jgi:hypothetical protein